MKRSASARALLTALGVAAGLAAGCARHAPAVGPAKAPSSAIRVGAKADPTVWGARLFPERGHEESAFGIEPGGGVRGMASGIRTVSLASGAVLAAEDKLPAAPNSVVPVPERMGGGFLFVLGNAVWRADRWLGRARPVHVARWPTIEAILVGLDRIYLRASSGALEAIDARTGAVLDLGALPATPHLGPFAAMDGWRAVAVADLRGVLATFDAGASWQPLDLPIDARQVRRVDDGIAVGGANASRAAEWYLVRPDGQVARLPRSPDETNPEAPAAPGAGDATPGTGPTPPLGKHPLAAAIEDGWPLADGTVAIARDGALAYVRLVDGAIVELVPDAFPLKPARCTAMALPDDADPAGFGFVCGEPRGRTLVYRYDARSARMVLLRAFDRPRAVLPSGRGALAIRGSCAKDASADEAEALPMLPERTTNVYCIRSRRGEFREVRLRGRAPGERVVALADGRIVVVTPPHGANRAASVTVVDDRANAKTSPIVFAPSSSVAPLPREVVRAIQSGMWLDGFEEREDGVVGGWIEAGGTFLGLRVRLDGQAQVGAYVRDTGWTVVSGRYGLGWTQSRRGYETTDGGMTWNGIELAERGADPRAIRASACGPAGCVLGGWVRTGWGGEPASPPPMPPAPKFEHPSPPAFELACEPSRGGPPPTPGPAPAPSPPRAFTLPSPWSNIGGPMRPAAVQNVDWSPFFAAPAPKLRTEELGLSLEVRDGLDRAADRSGRVGALLRLYAWGVKGVEWERSSRWLVRFSSPFTSSQDVFSTAASPPPQVVVDWSRTFTGGGLQRAVQSWQMASADDPRHALLVARRTLSDSIVLALEADRPPVEIRRADGEPFASLDAAVHLGGRWVLTGPPSTAETHALVVWEVEAGVAREVVRLPRLDVSGAPARLAMKPDGRSVALVVDGQPRPQRPLGVRWLLPIDLASGAVGEFERIGAMDFADRGDIGPCQGDEPGFVVDLPWIAPVHVKTGTQFGSALRSVVARVRVGRDRVCVERMSGSLEGSSSALAGSSGAGGANAPVRRDSPTIAITAHNARARFALRCVAR